MPFLRLLRPLRLIRMVVVLAVAVAVAIFVVLAAREDAPPARPGADDRATVAREPAEQLSALQRWPANFRPILAIDAGHGGIDGGAIGSSGLIEKEVVLAAARQLAALLEETGRYDPVLIREGDTYLRLEDRVARARAIGADMLISLHADANDDPAVAGASVYTVSDRASDAAATELAESGRAGGRIAGVLLESTDDSTGSLLIDLARRVTIRDSGVLARMLVEELSARTVVVSNTHRHAGFVVLMAPDVPSVLVELGMLSNAADATRLSDPEHVAGLTRAIARAVDRYFLWVMANGGA